MNVQEVFKHSILAEAAYADLTSGAINKNLLVAEGMSDRQATDFATKWTVIDQYRDSSGSAATIFQEISSGKKHLAVRGTQVTPGDLNSDYILALGFPSYSNPQFIQCAPS